jgi:hypothetical protein
MFLNTAFDPNKVHHASNFGSTLIAGAVALMPLGLIALLFAAGIEALFPSSQLGIDDKELK